MTSCISRAADRTKSGLGLRRSGLGSLGHFSCQKGGKQGPADVEIGFNFVALLNQMGLLGWCLALGDSILGILQDEVCGDQHQQKIYSYFRWK